MIIERKAAKRMSDLIQMFKDLFGAYAPIENIASTIDDGNTVTTTYAYSIDFGAITHYILLIILFYTVCRVIGSIITNMGRSVTIR